MICNNLFSRLHVYLPSISHHTHYCK
jgi:hypothetical protein